MLSFCVQKKLEGQVLERGSVDRHSLDENRLRKLINHAGEILGKIHSVKTNGFGSLDKDGAGKYKSFTELMRLNEKQQEAYLQLANKTAFSQMEMKEIINIVNEKSKGVTDTVACLNHGDYGAKHFIFEGDKITGILDWGEVCGNSPLYDFVRWDYWFADDIPTGWLIEGYGNKKVFEDYNEVLHWFRLSQGLESFWWYSQQSYPKAVIEAKNKLLTDLSFFA